MQFSEHFGVLSSKLRYLGALLPSAKDNSLRMAISCNGAGKVYLLDWARVSSIVKADRIGRKRRISESEASVFPSVAN